jgi:hypothetical protein
VLVDVGLEGTVAGSYDAQERADMIADLRSAFPAVDSEFLSSRQYDEHASYRTRVIKESLAQAEACTAADLDCGTKHGGPCEGPNGNVLDSVHEFRCDKVLDDHVLDYAVHSPVGTEWKADFHLPPADIWLEVDGPGRRPNKSSFQEKLDYYEELGYDHIVTQGTTELKRELRRRRVI